MCGNTGSLDRLSLAGLISAYDEFSWILVAILSITTLIVLRWYCGNTLWKSATYAAHLCIEQGIDLNTKTSKIIITVWLLMGIILTTGYKGDNIANLVSPVPYQKVRKFDDLIRENFLFYSRTEKSCVSTHVALIDSIGPLVGMANQHSHRFTRNIFGRHSTTRIT